MVVWWAKGEWMLGNNAYTIINPYLLIKQTEKSGERFLDLPKKTFNLQFYNPKPCLQNVIICLWFQKI